MDLYDRYRIRYLHTQEAWFYYNAYGLAGITALKGAHLLTGPKDSLSYFLRFYTELSDPGYLGFGNPAIGI